MNKYEKSLMQICLQCKTKPSNCNKNKCVRYNNIKELISNNYLFIIFNYKYTKNSFYLIFVIS